MPSFFLDQADTDYNRTIDQLVELQRKRSYRFYTNLNRNTLYSTAINDLKEQLFQLQKVTKQLFGLRSVFRETKLTSSDPESLTGSAKATAVNKIKSVDPSLNHEVEIERLAKAQVIASAALPISKRVPTGSIQLIASKNPIRFSFPGGTFKDFKVFLETNKTLDNSLSSFWAQKNEKEFVLLLTSKKPGIASRIQIIEDKSGILTTLGFFRRKKPLLIPLLTKTDFLQQSLPFSRRQGLKLFPGCKKTVKINKLLDFSKVKEARFSFFRRPLFKIEKSAISNAAAATTNTTAPISSNSCLPATAPYFATLYYSIQNQNDVFSPKNTSSDFPKQLSFSTNNLAFPEIWLDPFILKIKPTQKILLHSLLVNNPTEKEVYLYNKFLYENKPRTPDKFIPLYELTKAENAKLKYRGLEIERDNNSIDNLLEGITLNLKKPTTKKTPIHFSVTPHNEKIIGATFELVELFNLAVQTLNIYIAPNRKSLNAPGLIASYQERVGILRSEIVIKRLKERFSALLSKPYPTEERKTLLAKIGMTRVFNLSHPYSIEVDKISFSQNIFQNSLNTDHQLVQQLFAYDSSKNMIIDVGFIYELNTLLKSYLQTGGILDALLESKQQENKSIQAKIAKEETRIENFREKTERDFTKLEAAKREQKEMQDWFKNLQGN